MRWAISSVLLVGILILNKRTVPLVVKWREFAVLGFCGIFAFSTLTYLGLRSISASQAGMISAGIPIAILLFTPLVLKEPIKARAWLGVVVSIGGVVILLQGRQGAAAHGSLLGDLEIALACVAWGLYTVFGKRYGQQMDPLTLTAGAALYGTAFSALSCLGVVDLTMIHMTGPAWLCVFYVSTCASVGAYVAWTSGVRIVGAGRAAPYINLLPVWTVILGVLLLHEHISALSLVGGAVTILGAAWASL